MKNEGPFQVDVKNRVGYGNYLFNGQINRTSPEGGNYWTYNIRGTFTFPSLVAHLYSIYGFLASTSLSNVLQHRYFPVPNLQNNFKGHLKRHN